MKRIPSLLLLTTILSIILSPRLGLSEDGSWKKVDEGLYVGEFTPPETSKIYNSRTTIVKISPRFYSFKLLCASEHGKTKMTVKQWGQKHNLISAINAGMYQEDGIRNVGYMKNYSHINNPRLNAYKAVLAFNPSESTLPEIQIIDLRCQDFEKLRDKYQTLIQNIRMISCQQENVWRKQDKAWGLAVFGMDKSGNVLFVFMESLCSGFEVANILLSLPISIYNAMYLEGGQEASLYFSGKGIEFERIGRPISLNENGTVPVALPVPNILGIVKRSK